jgi:2-methylcitrate dehydratase PrpD
VESGKDVSVATGLARFVADLELASVPPDVVEKANCCLLYGLGIGLCSFPTQFAPVAARAAEMIDCNTAGQATTWFNGRKSSVNAAVLANSALLHGRCQEDTSGTAHLGVIVLPLALALLEARILPLARLLPAIIAGYEIGGHLEAALARHTVASGFRASPVYGTFAAAAGVCKLLDMPAPAIRSALVHAAAFTGGTLQAIGEGSDEWRYQVGIAAGAGFAAAELARAGAAGAAQGFEGKQGFARAFARTDLPQDFCNRFGADWSIRRVTFKPYPLCAHNQTVVTVALRLRQQVEYEQIEHCEIHIDPYIVPGMDFQGPFSRVAETLMSSSFCAAAALVLGRVDMAELEVFNDPAIMRTVRKMSLVSDREVIFPACKLVTRLRSGKTVVVEERATPRDYDLSRKQIGEQLRRMATYTGVPESSIAKLESFVGQLPHSDVSEVTEAFAQVRSAQTTEGVGAV